MSSSTLKVILVMATAISCHIVMAPPSNASKTNRNYRNETISLPLVVTTLNIAMWIAALHELAVYLIFGPAMSVMQSDFASRVGPIICPATSSPRLNATPFFLLSAFLGISGALLRKLCYAHMGRLFTFHLTIAQDHKLVQSGPYGIVRHPSYAGAFIAAFGLMLQFTFPESRPSVIECGLIGPVYNSLPVQIGFTLYWTFTLYLVTNRALAEDAELRKTFGEEWEVYASKVRYWWFPFIV